MSEPQFDLGTYYPILAYLALLIVFAVGTLIAAHTIGPRHDTKGKQVPYESGMDPIGDARQRFDIKFYLVAIMFLVFDVELLFLYPWAVVAYSPGEEVQKIATHPGAPSGPLPGPISVAYSEQLVGFPDALKLPVFCGVMVFIVVLLIGYLYDWKKGVFKWR